MIELKPASEETNPAIINASSCLVRMVITPISAILFIVILSWLAIQLELGSSGGMNQGLSQFCGVGVLAIGIGFMVLFNRLLTTPIVNFIKRTWVNLVHRKVGQAEVAVSTAPLRPGDTFTVTLNQPVLEGMVVERVDFELFQRETDLYYQEASRYSMIAAAAGSKKDKMLTEAHVEGRQYSDGETLKMEATLQVPLEVQFESEKKNKTIDHLLRVRVRIDRWADFMQVYVIDLEPPNTL